MSKRDRVILIVDRSASMFSLANEASGAINNFIKEQKEVEGKCDFQLVEFDDVIDHHSIQPMQEVSDYTLKPRGMTALMDAMGTTLNEEALKKWPKKTYKSNICVVVTDGQENCSKEYNSVRLSAIVEGLEKDGWEFVFLASNVDPSQLSSSVGAIQSANIASSHSGEGYVESYFATSSYVGNLRKGLSKAEATRELDELKKSSKNMS